jgi:hypothetical protein
MKLFGANTAPDNIVAMMCGQLFGMPLEYNPEGPIKLP